MVKINLKKIIGKSPFLLAPMDDVTDVAFRKLCENEGCAYTTTELTSVEALIRGKVLESRYKKGNLKINCVQLFGKNPSSFVKALEVVDYDADIIDVNFGCPSANVTKNDCGAMLLKDPKNVGKIISDLTNNTNKPITAKIRLGYDKINYKEIAKEIEDSGAELLTIHGRTAKQKYSGKANWEAIKEVFLERGIIIVGNGDVKEEEQIEKYLGKYCDALMIGRGAIGNPLLFKKFNYYLKHREKLVFDEMERKEIQKKLFFKYVKYLGDYEFSNENLKIKRQASWFFKGFEGIKELREKLNKVKDKEEVFKLIQEF